MVVHFVSYGSIIEYRTIARIPLSPKRRRGVIRDRVERGDEEAKQEGYRKGRGGWHPRTMKRFSVAPKRRLVGLAFQVAVAMILLFAPPAAVERRSAMLPQVVDAFSLGRSSKSQRRRISVHHYCWVRPLHSSLGDENQSSNTRNGQGQESSDEVEYRSISDYVGGLHGGKYEFDPRLSGITSINYEKSVVFGNVTPKNVNLAVAPAPDEIPPKWASRPVDHQARLVHDIRLAADEGSASVVLVNEELSWETFFVSLESASGEAASCCYTVTPTSGNLAPRGGTNKYSDHVRLTVESTVPSASGDPALYLVARTECDAWVWRLINQ